MLKAFASTTGYIRLPQRGSHKEANNAAEFDVSDTAGASAMEMLIEADYGAEVKVGTFDELIRLYCLADERPLEVCR